jgi:hypothetical protein
MASVSLTLTGGGLEDLREVRAAGPVHPAQAERGATQPPV